uniref:Uncharacterized protein n=1 Tax=Setaria italica TaxID=4555 RepID=K3ZPN7_SETIT
MADDDYNDDMDMGLGAAPLAAGSQVLGGVICLAEPRNGRGAPQSCCAIQ